MPRRPPAPPPPASSGGEYSHVCVTKGTPGVTKGTRGVTTGTFDFTKGSLGVTTGTPDITKGTRNGTDNGEIDLRPEVFLSAKLQGSRAAGREVAQSELSDERDVEV